MRLKKAKRAGEELLARTPTTAKKVVGEDANNGNGAANNGNGAANKGEKAARSMLFFELPFFSKTLGQPFWTVVSNRILT